MSPHINISYERASGSGYKHTQIIFNKTKASMKLPNSFDNASSHQAISGSRPSYEASFFQS